MEQDRAVKHVSARWIYTWKKNIGNATGSYLACRRTLRVLWGAECDGPGVGGVAVVERDEMVDLTGVRAGVWTTMVSRVSFPEDEDEMDIRDMEEEDEVKDRDEDM